MTDAELHQDCAVELGLVREGDGAFDNADWSAWFAKKSDQVRAFLVQRQLCWWPVDVIPADVSLGLTMMVATAARSKWGKDYNQAAAGLELISEAGANRPAGEHTRAKFY